jgi:hypothetical protein
LSDTDRENLDDLREALDDLLASEPACPGDRNLDKVGDGRDLAGVRRDVGGASWYDFNDDGITNTADAATVRANLARNCLAPRGTPPAGRRN